MALGLKSIDKSLFEVVKHRASMILLEGNKLIDENLRTTIKSLENLYSWNNEEMTKQELEKTVVKVSYEMKSLAISMM